MVSYLYSFDSLIGINEIGKYVSYSNIQTIDSGHPWRTPCIRVKGSDRRPFILIFDWMLVNATLIMRMNLTPYPNICKSEEIKSQSTLPKTLRILQRGFYSIYLTYQLHHK